MEKYRSSVILKREKNDWHPRKTLSLGINRLRFHSEYRKSKHFEYWRISEEGKNMFSMMIDWSYAETERLQSKHVVGDK